MSSIAIQAARLRLTTTQKWVDNSEIILQNAQQQVTASKNEWHNARNYLDELLKQHEQQQQQHKKNGNVSGNMDNGKQDEKLLLVSSTLSGDTENMTLDSSSNNNSHSPTNNSEDGLPVGEYVNYLTGRTTDVTSNQILISPKEEDWREKTKKDTVDSVAQLQIENNGRTRMSDNVTSSNTSTTSSSEHWREKTRKEIAHSVAAATTRSMTSRESISSSADQSTSLSTMSTTTTTRDVGSCTWVQVTGCGIPEINGKYHKFEYSDGAPSFSKIDKYDGKESFFTIARYPVTRGNTKWCITCTIPPNRQLVFYVAYTTSFAKLPPQKSWLVVVKGSSNDELDGNEGAGLQTVPMIMHEPAD